MRDYIATLIGLVAVFVTGVCVIFGVLSTSVLISAFLFLLGVFIVETLVPRSFMDGKSKL